MELTQGLMDKIEKTHDTVIEIATILGKGESGLCAEVRNHNKRIGRIELVVVAIIGSGALSGGASWLVRVLGG